jgi:hypothetical protein
MRFECARARCGAIAANYLRERATAALKIAYRGGGGGIFWGTFWIWRVQGGTLSQWRGVRRSAPNLTGTYHNKTHCAGQIIQHGTVLFGPGSIIPYYLGCTVLFVMGRAVLFGLYRIIPVP